MSANEPISHVYFEWLYSHIASLQARNPSRTVWALAQQLYTKEFIWLVPNDDNRISDGKDLRYKFLEEEGLALADVDPYWLDEGCSMLEMLIALSQRLSFEADEVPAKWFWEMMDNLDLSHYSDSVYNEEMADLVDETLDRVIWRTYSPNGDGGLFPLRRARKDQRKVELWYQLNEYLLAAS
jgi:hypothetical protein